METNEQTPTNSIEESLLQEEPIEPVEETKLKKGLTTMGKIVVIIVVFIVLFAFVMVSHTYSYHL